MLPAGAPPKNQVLTPTVSIHFFCYICHLYPMCMLFPSQLSFLIFGGTGWIMPPQFLDKEISKEMLGFYSHR